MAYKLQFSPLALQDLDETFNYINESLQNPIAAHSTIDGILDSLDILKTSPEAGKKIYIGDDTFSGYRFIQRKNYLSFYRIEGKKIFVDRILYAKRDYMKILFE